MDARTAAAIRESAVARIDQALGFGRVPPAIRSGAESVRQERDSAARPVAEYSRRARDQMAVLDYVIANTDRGPGSWRTDRDGAPIAIGHPQCFPERTRLTTDMAGRGVIRSDFVDWALGVPLDDEVIAAARAVDLNRLWIELLSIGLSSTMTAAALARLSEVAGSGMITGRAWPHILPVARTDQA